MKHTLLASLVAAAIAHPAHAADEQKFVIEHRTFLAAADEARTQADSWKRWADDYSREMRSSMGAMYGARLGMQKIVKGAPYSAEVLTETNQGLADGNVISRKTRGAVYRDGEGRTRQESPGDGKEQAVFISDPVDGKSYVLTPGGKRAMTGSINHNQLVSVNGRTVRVENGRVFVDGKESTQPVVEVNASGKNIKVENGKVTIDGRDVDSPNNVNIHVVRGPEWMGHPPPPKPPAPPAPPEPGATAAPPAPPVPPMPPLPGVHNFRFESLSKLGKGVTTSLGTKDFDGLKAEGKSTVWTIPAGEIGNKNAINVSSESWYSPELQVTVYSRYNDPRTGESIFRLAGIKRAEPAADLFKVPADYETRGKERARAR